MYFFTLVNNLNILTTTPFSYSFPQIISSGGIIKEGQHIITFHSRLSIYIKWLHKADFVRIYGTNMPELSLSHPVY